MSTAITIHPSAAHQVGFAAPSGILKMAARQQLMSYNRGLLNPIDPDLEKIAFGSILKGLKSLRKGGLKGLKGGLKGLKGGLKGVVGAPFQGTGKLMQGAGKRLASRFPAKANPLEAVTEGGKLTHRMKTPLLGRAGGALQRGGMKTSRFGEWLSGPKARVDRPRKIIRARKFNPNRGSPDPTPPRPAAQGSAPSTPAAQGGRGTNIERGVAEGHQQNPLMPGVDPNAARGVPAGEVRRSRGIEAYHGNTQGYFPRTSGSARAAYSPSGATAGGNAAAGRSGIDLGGLPDRPAFGRTGAPRTQQTTQPRTQTSPQQGAQRGTQQGAQPAQQGTPQTPQGPDVRAEQAAQRRSQVQQRMEQARAEQRRVRMQQQIRDAQAADRRVRTQQPATPRQTPRQTAQTQTPSNQQLEQAVPQTPRARQRQTDQPPADQPPANQQQTDVTPEGEGPSWFSQPLWEGAPAWATRGMGLGAGGLYYMTNKQSSQRGHDVLASVDQHTGRVAMEKKALNLRGLAIPAAAGLGGAGLGALLASRVQSERYEPSRMPMGAGAVYGPRYALEEFADDAGDAEDEAALQEALAELQESGAVYDPYDEMVYKGASDRGRQRARVFAEELSKLASAALDTMVEGGLISPQVAAEFGQSHDISKLANVFYAYGTAAAVADAAEDPT